MDFNSIFVNRIGKSLNSFMKTIKLIRTIEPGTWVILENNKLLDANEPDNTHEIICDKLYEQNDTGINCVSVSGRFIKNFLGEASSNNILGKNDWFITETKHISIPVTKTTKQNLKFFGCTLIEPGCSFKLVHDQILPLFEVSIGKNYVKDYLLEPEFGDGFYIETHNTPHYHQPLSSKCSGHLILGIFIESKLILTKFAIPYGYGIYMPGNTLHSDAFLIGDYAVVYTKTLDYSTYLITTTNRKIVQVE